MGADAEAFAVEVLRMSERIGKSFAYLYRLDESDVSGVVVQAAYERERYLVVAMCENRAVAERVLRQAVKAHYRRERVQSLSQTDQYFYEPQYVRLFLPYFFSVEDWRNGPVQEECSSEWRTGEALDTAIDIKGAWDGLTEPQQDAIVTRHLTHAPGMDGRTDWDAIADVLGRANGGSARDAYAVATRELAFEMNVSRIHRIDDYVGPGSREVLSNAQARTRLGS